MVSSPTLTREASSVDMNDPRTITIASRQTCHGTAGSSPDPSVCAADGSTTANPFVGIPIMGIPIIGVPRNWSYTPVMAATHNARQQESSTKAEAEPSPLLDLPAFALVRLGRNTHAAVRAAFTQAGLSARTHFVLLCLHEYGQLSQRELADHVDMDRSDLVRLLDELEDSEQVRRDTDPHDRRRHVVSITPRGNRTLRRGQHLVDHATETVLSGLGPGDQATLHRLVRHALDTPN